MGRELIDKRSKGWQSFLLALSIIALSACGGGGSTDSDSSSPNVDSGGGTPSPSTIQISGLAIDGPLSNANVVVFDAAGNQVAQATTDATGRFTVSVPVSAPFPLTIRVTGGTDTVTGSSASIELAGVITSSAQSILLTPFSTLAVRTAECGATNSNSSPLAARNALTNQTLNSLLGTLLSFGLNSTVRSQLFTSIPADSAQAISLLLSSEQMVEVLRRASQSLAGSSPNQVLNLLACDMVNGIFDGTETGSSTLVAALFQLVAAEVLMEAAAGQLKVGGQVVNGRLDSALTATFRTSGVAPLTLDSATLTLLKRIVAAANSAQPSLGLGQLSAALNNLTPPVTDLSGLSSLFSPSPLRPLIQASTPPSTAFLAAMQASAPVPLITLFSATPSTVASSAGGVTTLQWSADNATFCERSGAGLGWNGSGGATGTINNVGPVVLNSTFTLTCTGPGGTVSQTVNVFVPPAANITFSPATANLGESVTMTISSTNASSCNATLTGNGGGVIVSGGSFAADVGNGVTATCNGPGGSVLVSKSLPVRAARLTWTAPTQTEDGTAVSLEGFRIYHGTTSGSRSSFIDITDPNLREYTSAFPTGPRFFEITAISNGSLEGRYSNEASKVIP